MPNPGLDVWGSSQSNARKAILRWSEAWESPLCPRRGVPLYEESGMSPTDKAITHNESGRTKKNPKRSNVSDFNIQKCDDVNAEGCHEKEKRLKEDKEN